MKVFNKKKKKKKHFLKIRNNKAKEQFHYF